MQAQRPKLVFFGLLFVVFTCVFPYNGWLNNPNENSRTFMTMAIVEEGMFCVDSMVQKFGSNADFAIVPTEGTNEKHIYSLKAPATSYSGVPPYWVFSKLAPLFGHSIPAMDAKPEDKAWWLRASTLVLRLFSVQIPCFAFLVWFERWLRATTRDTVLRLTAVAAVGVGTNFLGYAMMFASHAMFAVATFVCFAMIYEARTTTREAGERKRGNLALLAGFFCGLGPLYEYQAFPVALVLGFYGLFTFRAPRLLVRFVLGGAIDIVTMMYFQWMSFGSPFTPGHKFAGNAEFHETFSRGFFGLEKVDFDVFAQLSLSHAFGFFGLSPYMWLGLLSLPFVFVLAYGTATERRERRVGTLVWALAMLGLWLSVSALHNWRGGWTVGPRYLGAAPPFFAFGAVVALEGFAGTSWLRRAIARGVSGGLTLASAISIGVVELHLNTLPDVTVTRPLVQITLPLASAGGFVPYHAGDLIGWDSPTFWYIVCACLIASVLVAAFARDAETWRGYAIRALCFAVTAGLGLLPAWSEPTPPEEAPAQTAIHTRADLEHNWEPARSD